MILSIRSPRILSPRVWSSKLTQAAQRNFQTLISGLGNPKEKYSNTRHNVGVIMTELIKNKIASNEKWIKFGRKPIAEYCSLDSQNTILFKNTGGYMNLSGNTFLPMWKQLLKEKKPADGVTNCIVVFDDLDTPFGKVKLRNPGASTRGHNGLKDITKRLGHLNFYKLAIGIGRPTERDPEIIIDYVLSPFSNSEMITLKEKCLPEALKLLQPFIKNN